VEIRCYVLDLRLEGTQRATGKNFLVVLPGDVMYIKEPTDTDQTIKFQHILNEKKLENIEVLHIQQTYRKKSSNPRILGNFPSGNMGIYETLKLR
jgi:hypothetical protein